MGIVLAVACLGLAACASAKDEPAKPAAPKAENAVAPVEDAPAKAESSVAPAEDLMAKAEKSVTPAEDILAKVEKSVAPAEDLLAKAENAVAPVEDAPAKAESSVAPAGVALVKAGAKQAYTTNIVRLIAGQTIYGTGSTGRTFMIYFSPKGSMKMSAAEGKFRDSGTWRVENSTLCYTWKNPKTGNDCEKVFVLPDGKVVYTTGEGKQGSFDAFGEGNLENL